MREPHSSQASPPGRGSAAPQSFLEKHLEDLRRVSFDDDRVPGGELPSERSTASSLWGCSNDGDPAVAGSAGPALSEGGGSRAALLASEAAAAGSGSPGEADGVNRLRPHSRTSYPRASGVGARPSRLDPASLRNQTPTLSAAVAGYPSPDPLDGLTADPYGTQRPSEGFLVGQPFGAPDGFTGDVVGASRPPGIPSRLSPARAQTAGLASFGIRLPQAAAPTPPQRSWAGPGVWQPAAPPPPMQHVPAAGWLASQPPTQQGSFPDDELPTTFEDGPLGQLAMLLTMVGESQAVKGSSRAASSPESQSQSQSQSQLQALQAAALAGGGVELQQLQPSYWAGASGIVVDAAAHPSRWPRNEFVGASGQWMAERSTVGADGVAGHAAAARRQGHQPSSHRPPSRSSTSVSDLLQREMALLHCDPAAGLSFFDSGRAPVSHGSSTSAAEQQRRELALNYQLRESDPSGLLADGARGVSTDGSFHGSAASACHGMPAAMAAVTAAAAAAGGGGYRPGWRSNDGPVMLLARDAYGRLVPFVSSSCSSAAGGSRLASLHEGPMLGSRASAASSKGSAGWAGGAAPQQQPASLLGLPGPWLIAAAVVGVLAWSGLIVALYSAVAQSLVSWVLDTARAP